MCSLTKNLNISVSIIIKCLIIISVSFNFSFGCIPVSKLKKTETIKNVPQQIHRNGKLYVNLRDTLNRIRANRYTFDEISIMKQFGTFLNIQKKLNLTYDNLNFIWKALQEFAIQRSYLWKRHQRRRRYYKSKYTIKSDELNQRLKHLKTKQLINVNGRKLVDRQSKLRLNRELYQAKSYSGSFYNTSCNVVKRIFDVEKYLQYAKYSFYNTSNTYVFSKGILYKRCPEECACIDIQKICLPTKTSEETVYIALLKSRTHRVKVEPIHLMSHEKCGCLLECSNRRCIEPFTLDTESCTCKCKRGRTTECDDVLRGNTQFSINDYRCIASRRCLTPLCEAGELTEEYLYSRKCPSIS